MQAWSAGQAVNQILGFNAITECISEPLRLLNRKSATVLSPSAALTTW